MCFQVGEHISLGIRFSQEGEHISLGIYASLGIYVSQVGEHISLGIRVSQVGEHISLGIYVSQVGEHISLGICVPGCRVLGFASFTFLKLNHTLVLACEQALCFGKGWKNCGERGGNASPFFHPFPNREHVHRLLSSVLNHYASFLLYYIRIYYIVKPFLGDYDTTPSPFYLVQHKVPIESVPRGISISHGPYESQRRVVNSLMWVPYYFHLGQTGRRVL